jgi:hypothetical protein
VPLKDVHAWEEGFLKFIHEERKPLWQKITDSKKMDDATTTEVDHAITDFQKRYAGKKESVTV